MKPTLIFCAAGNRRLAQIAIDKGFKYGAQLPGATYFPLFFADQNWKNPNREGYMMGLMKESLVMATVLDWEREEQLSEVLDWAEEASQYIEQVIIIPKVMNGIKRLPKTINGRQVVLGYSVPTRYGGTFVPSWEFAGWPIHLLGGSPQKQMLIWRYFCNMAEVISADGSMMSKMATQRNQFWANGDIPYAKDRHWPMLKEIGIERIEDAPYEAFRRSCENIMGAWDNL